MVRVELKGYQEAIGILGEKPVQRAASSALKKVAKSAVSTASTEIRRVYNVKKADLDPRIEVRPPRFNDLVAEIKISGKGMSLSFFGARQTSVNKVITRGKGGLKTKTTKRSATFQGVQVEVEKGKRTQLKSAFLVRMKSGHVGVMRRDPKGVMKSRGKYAGTKHAQAIVEKQVISMAHMVQSTKVEPAVLAKVQESWDKTFPQELNYQLNVKGKK